jgi:hypothetical protein
LQIGNENDDVRFLINCLLRDNRVEFEEELKCQNVNNIVIGIRMALRNCTSTIVPYEYYEDFVKHERGIYEKFSFFFFYRISRFKFTVY